jgi:biotin synthase
VKAKLSETIGRLEHTGGGGRDDLARLLAAEGEAAVELAAAADRVRAAEAGDGVHLRALIEFSNHCRRECLYCGLRRGRRGLARYRMTEEEIVGCADTAAALGFRTVVLQSGEDQAYRAARLARVVGEIKRECDVAVTLSIGERPEEDYRLLREAGADRFLLRIETSSPALYARLHPDSDLGTRRECLQHLRRLGYQVGSGVLIGLPGQSLEMLADDLLALQELDLDMIGVGPFIPNPATPLGGEKGGGIGLAINFLACLRLLCRRALLPATTALRALDAEGWRKGLGAGADVLMLNVTPRASRDGYQLYPGKPEADEPAQELASATEMVRGLGRQVAEGYGHTRLDGLQTAGAGAAAGRAI